MSTADAARRKNRSTSPAAIAAGRGGGSAMARSLGRGVGLPPPRSRGRGAAAATTLLETASFQGTTLPPTASFPSSSVSMEGFPFPPGSSPPLFDVAGGDPSSPSWINPSSGFMSFFNNLPHNPSGGFSIDASPQEVENVLGNDNDTVRTEKRIMWTDEEDVSLMSAWIKHSTDSTCGADRSGGQYWGEVVETYNKTIPPLRRRSVKQCKDRWHKVNKLTDLFECAYVEARRVFTSGYSHEMWIDAAKEFYVVNNKQNKDVTGPFMLEKVWKICREETKWKTYNENLKNARKRKSFHLEGDSDDKDDDTPQRPTVAV